MFVLMGAVYLIAAGLAVRRWSVAATGLVAVVVQLVGEGVFKAPGQAIFSVVTHTDHLAGDAYRNIMIYMGLLERPSAFGLFYTDEVFGWMIDQDAVLSVVAPSLAVHHSYAHTGAVLVWEAITRAPLTIADAVYRRLLIQIFYRPLWTVSALRIDWTYTITVLSMGVVNICAWRRKPLFLILTPITLCLLVNQFALDTVMTLVHTHPLWHLLGVMLMFALAPLYIFAAVRMASSAERNWFGRSRQASIAFFRQRTWTLAAMVLVLGGVVWMVRFTLDTVRQERVYVRTWMQMHQPPPQGLDIQDVINRVGAEGERSGDSRGQKSMWMASLVKMYQDRHPATSAEQRQQLDVLRNTYFRRAIAAAPGDEHFLFAARFLGIDHWDTFLLQGLERFPGSIYAPGAAAALRYHAPGLSTAARRSVVRQYAELASTYLSRTGSSRPGFEPAPAAMDVLSGSPKTERTEHGDGSSGLVLTLARGTSVVLSRKPTYGSESVKLVTYVDLQEGSADFGLAVGGVEGRSRFTSVGAITPQTQEVSGKLQILTATVGESETSFGLWLSGGPQGAKMELRDYYPIVDYPQHYYRSGLMERVRRRASAAKTESHR